MYFTKISIPPKLSKEVIQVEQKSPRGLFMQPEKLILNLIHEQVTETSQDSPGEEE